MPNIELLEKSIPVAPIKIAALAGCQDLAREVELQTGAFPKRTGGPQSVRCQLARLQRQLFLD